MAARTRTALLVIGACLIAGCSSSPNKTSSSTSTVLVTAASFTTVIPTTTTSSTTPVDTEPDSSSGPLLTPDDAHSVADCVKFIPIGAVMADKEATNLWDVVGRDADELTGLCTDLLTTSPATLASLSLKLRAFEIAQEATTTTGKSTTGSTSESTSESTSAATTTTTVD